MLLILIEQRARERRLLGGGSTNAVKTEPRSPFGDPSCTKLLTCPDGGQRTGPLTEGNGKGVLVNWSREAGTERFVSDPVKQVSLSTQGGTATATGGATRIMSVALCPRRLLYNKFCKTAFRLDLATNNIFFLN